MTEPARVEREDEMEPMPARDNAAAPGPTAWDALQEVFAEHGVRATWVGEPKRVR